VIGARAFGGVLVVVGVVALVASIGVGDGWSPSGPGSPPRSPAAFLVWPGESLEEHIAEASRGTHWPTPALLVGLLLGYALLLSALGYALATTIFFWLAAWLLGSERPGRDAIVGIGLGIVTSYAFSHWLNVELPTGPWGV
jgi:hypothetical protein